MGLAGVYSLDEIARAAGVSQAQAQALAGRDGWFSGTEAVRLGRALVDRRRATTVPAPPSLFSRTSQGWVLDFPGVPLAVSSSLHLALLGAILVSLGFRPTLAANTQVDAGASERLVFVVTPGPGGGGGGGGNLHKAPPSRALRKGDHPLASPLPPPPPAPAVRELRPEFTPSTTVVAPIASAPNDDRDRSGVLTEASTQGESQGPGRGGGAGTGAGIGIGEGAGSGVGPGTSGGFGGGAYRPGSGITPPRVVREVKGDYTEDARRRGITGEVVMEVVVLRDGSVGEVRLLHGLGVGLDERAAAAVRQWRFAPAERQGVPVDVIVEVGMEFKLR